MARHTQSGFWRLRFPALAAMMLLLAGCEPVRRTHGSFFRPSDLAELSIGSSTRSDVSAVLGTPTVTSDLGGERWVYVGQVSEQSAFLEPEITKREVVIVDFSPDGAVANIKQLDLAAGIAVDPVGRETPTEGRDLTILQQVFGNIGRFAQPVGAPAQ